MDHGKHIAKMSPLQCHQPEGEFSIFEDEGWHPESETISKRLKFSLLVSALLPTDLDGIPSTRIMRLSFFRPSSTSADRLDFDDLC